MGSAANAKMNDGGLNNEVYNQDYVWSANYSGNNGVAPTPAFDGTGPKDGMLTKVPNLYSTSLVMVYQDAL